MDSTTRKAINTSPRRGEGKKALSRLQAKKSHGDSRRTLKNKGRMRRDGAVCPPRRLVGKKKKKDVLYVAPETFLLMTA